MTEIYDSNGTRITVGARVLDPDPTALSAGGVVTEITEPDGDVNVYGRPVAVGPFVTVTYDDGTIERWLAHWNATGPWDDHRTDYTCDDVTVADVREPDGQRMEAGRIVPTDR
jgi:hypothetical protein